MENRDSKCLDLALKHIDTLEMKIDTLENDMAQSAALHYKKNIIIQEFMNSDLFHRKMQDSFPEDINWNMFIDEAMKEIEAHKT